MQEFSEFLRDGSSHAEFLCDEQLLCPVTSFFMSVPLDLDQYNAQIAKELEHVKSIVEDDGWKVDKKDKDITFYLRYEAPSKFAQVKSVVTIKKPVDEVFDYVKTVRVVDEHTPADQREGCVERRTLNPIEGDPNEAQFYYIVVETHSRLVSSRDFLMYQKVFKEGDKRYLLRTSIVNDALKPPHKSYVRANMHFQAFVMEPCPDGCKLTFLCHADPSGSVPAMIYNAAASNQGRSALRFKQALEK